MIVLALILSLSNGGFEIRTEQSFMSMRECVEYGKMRLSKGDFRQGDVAITCAHQDSVEGVIETLFGNRV